MNELITAASMLLAVIGLLYSAWYSEITTALSQPVPRHKDDRDSIRRVARVVYQTRSVPLAVSSTLLAAILIPSLLSEVGHAIALFRTVGFRAIQEYDAVKTLFCVVACTSIGLAVHTVELASRARSYYKKTQA